MIVPENFKLLFGRFSTETVEYHQRGDDQMTGVKEEVFYDRLIVAL
jgi:hypothetical protein